MECQQNVPTWSKRRSFLWNGFRAAWADSIARSLPQFIGWALAAALLLPCRGSTVSADDPRGAVVLRGHDVTESSGLAFSHRRPDRIWTHNDSGDGPRIFAFDLDGNLTGKYQLEGEEAVDWEDMASFVVDGQPRLLVADVGDNQRRREHVTVHLFDEPDPDRSGVLSHQRTVSFRYPEGPQDCEAVAVDVRRRQILLVTKEFLPLARVYALPLGPRSEPQESGVAENSAQNSKVVEATYLFRLPMPLVTAMDISADSRSLLLCGYFDLFIYRTAEETRNWQSMLETEPSHQVLPRLPQIEGACFDPQRRVWVSSEGRPGTLVRLPEAGEDAAPRVK